MAEERLVVKIVAQDETSAGVESARGGLRGLGIAVVGLAAGGLAVAGEAAAGLAAGLVDCTREAMAAEQVQAQLAAVLAQTGGVTGVTAEMTNQLADKFSRLTMFDDESILGGQAVLARFREIGADVFPQATDAMLDLAQAMGTDVQTAATTLGKALATPGEGLLRLKAAGVTFTEQETKNLQAMADSGQAAEAQAIILQRLQESIGTVAEAAGSTATGQWTIFNNQIANVKESLGAALLPALTMLGGKLTEALSRPEVQAAIQTLAEKLGELAATVLPPLVDFLMGPVMNAFVSLLNVLSGQGGGGGLSQTLADVATFVQPVTDALGALIEALRELWAVVASVLVPALGPLIEALRELWAVVASVLVPALGPLIEALRELWAVVASVLVPALKQLGAIVTNVVLPVFVNQLLTMLQTLIGAFSGFVTFLTGVVNMIVGLFTGDMTQAREGARQVMEGILQIFESLGRGVLTSVENLVRAVIQAFAQLGIDIVTPVQGVIDSVVETMRALPEKLVEIGKNAIAGLADGIKSAAESAVDAATSVVDSVVGGVKGFLDMHSPSLVFVEIGRGICDGLIVGLRRGKPAAVSEVRQMAGAVVDAWLVSLHGAQYRISGGQKRVMFSTDWLEETRRRAKQFLKDAVVTPGMSLETVVQQVQSSLLARMLEAEDPQRRKIGQLMTHYADRIQDFVGQYAAALRAMGEQLRFELAESMLGAAGVFGGVGTAAAERYRDQAIKPLEEQLRILEDQLGVLERQEGTTAQQAQLNARIVGLKQQIAEREEKITALQQQQADLKFLEAQVQLVKLIREQGLDARQILGGLELGLNADLPGLIQAMTAAMQQMIAAAQAELGMHSPSRVFEAMGENMMRALGGGVQRAAPAAVGAVTGAVGRVVNNTYNLTANYRYESPTTLAQRVRMLQMMAR